MKTGISVKVTGHDKHDNLELKNLVGSMGKVVKNSHYGTRVQVEFPHTIRWIHKRNLTPQPNTK